MESVPSSRKTAVPADPKILLEKVERFLGTCRQPSVIEPGDPPLPLRDDSFRLSPHGPRLLLEAWSGERNLVRRIMEVTEESPRVLVLTVERFGGKAGRMLLLDLDQPLNTEKLRKCGREVLREQFRVWLSRQFPGWRIAELTTGPDLRRTLSPVYPRAMLAKGSSRIAAICAPADKAQADSALAFGLIWLDYLRRREHPRLVGGLAIFLPLGSETSTLLRSKFLNPSFGQVIVFRYDQEGFEHEADPEDTGNLMERLQPLQSVPAEPVAQTEIWAHRISLLPDVEAVDVVGFARSFRIHGLEFARLAAGNLTVGVDRKRVARSLDDCERVARELARWRSPEPEEAHHPWYMRKPEAWIESQVRQNIQTIDPGFDAAPVYGQISAVAGRERGVLDLLARDRTGRLAVLEIKATKDPTLPIQALDYWIRVRAHAIRGEFESGGYFPGRFLSRQPPRLLLIAPALEFHSTTETILRFLSEEVSVERIGLSVEWHRKLRVVERL